MSYQDTCLYKTGFGKSPLKAKFEAMRSRVETLLAGAHFQLKGLTVHDVTHLDTLWEMAAKVAGAKIKLNPSEAFVLGGAILLHDAGNSLAAYHNGIESLKALPLWQDYAKKSNLDNTQLAFKVIRKIHADEALTLIDKEFKDDKGRIFHLIEDVELRLQLGNIIGLIAQSHGKEIEFLDKADFKERFVFGNDTVDPLKIACLLRAADAIHLNINRAPYFVRSLIKPLGESALHWDFQQKLLSPHYDVSTQSLSFKSTSPFKKDEQEAWWKAFDHLSWASNELQKCERILLANGREPFAAKSVKGAHHPVALSEYVKTEGWIPYDSRIKISEPSKVAANLGGSKLYGEEPKVALRELLQNAMDAVRARRVIDTGYEGEIHVALEEREGAWWLSVEDNGVGMSQFVLTDVLLDFGKSLWKSDDVAEEFKGLAASGFEANGRHGIGFYSVFILGDHVRVTTLKHGTKQEAYVLEFTNGLKDRPNLSIAKAGYVSGGGTKVEVKLKIDDMKFHPFFGLYINGSFKKIDTFTLFITRITPASEVNIICSYQNEIQKIIQRDDWVTISDEEFFKRLNVRNKYGQEVKFDALEFKTTVLDNGIAGKDRIVYGRVCLNNNHKFGFLIEKGLIISNTNLAYYGVMQGVSVNLERSKGVIEAKALAKLVEWATNQKAVILNSSLTFYNKYCLASARYDITGIFDDMPIFMLNPHKLDREYIDGTALIALLHKHQKIYYFHQEISNEDYSPSQLLKFDYEEILFETSHYKMIDDLVAKHDLLVEKNIIISLTSRQGAEVEMYCTILSL